MIFEPVAIKMFIYVGVIVLLQSVGLIVYDLLTKKSG